MTQPTDGAQLDFEVVRGILDRYFATGDLEAAIEEAGPEDLSAAGLFDYVSNSPEARQYFDQLAVTDRAISGPSDLEEAVGEPSAFERDFGDAAFDEKLDNLLDGESPSYHDGGDAVAPEDTEDGSRRAAGVPESGEGAEGDDTTVISLFGSGRAATLAAAAMAALVAGALLIDFESNSRSEDGGDFQPRSAASVDDEPTFADPELELFCAQSRAGQLDIRGTTDREDGRLNCPLDAELKLGYRNRSPNLAYAAFFGVAKSGTIYWYGPSPAAPEPVGVESTDETVPVGETIRLNVNHEPGPVRVHAVLSPEPIDHAELARQLDRKSDRELWRSRDLTFEQMPTASTSTMLQVVDAETGSEEAR